MDDTPPPAARAQCLGCRFTWDLPDLQTAAMARRWGKPYAAPECPSCGEPFSLTSQQLLMEVIEHRSIFTAGDPPTVLLVPQPQWARGTKPRGKWK